VRDRITAWFERNTVRWELFMAALAIAFVVLRFLPVRGPAITGVELAISAFFLAEFLLRIGASRARMNYLLNHWMDLVAIFPTIPGYQDAAFARMARLLRLLIVLRLLGSVDRFMTHVRGVTAQPGLTYLVGVITVLVAGGGAVAFFAERGSNPTMDSYSKAVYWAVITVTTVGYGDILPITSLGRSMAGLIVIGGLVLWSLLTASIISYLTELTKRKPDGNPAVEDLKERLDRLDSMSRDEMLSLQGALNALLDSRIAIASTDPHRARQPTCG